VVIAGVRSHSSDRKLNREARSETSRRERGIVAVIVLSRGGGCSGWLSSALPRQAVGAAVEAVLIAVLVAQRSLYEHVAAVAAALVAAD